MTCRPRTLFTALPVFGTKPTSVSGAPAAVSTSHGASTSVTNVHAAPAVSTPGHRDAADFCGRHPQLWALLTLRRLTRPQKPMHRLLQQCKALQLMLPRSLPLLRILRPVVPTYQDPSAYPVYYNPQPAFNPYYQPFPFVNAGGASGSKTVYELPYVQSVYQPPQSNAGYYQPFPYSGYVPGFGRPSTYPTSQVFPAYSASPATEAHHTGSVTAMKEPSVTKSTMIGNYQASPVASLMYRDSAPAVSGDHMTPGVATAHTTYQAAPGTVMVHSTPRHNDCTLSSSLVASTYQAVDHTVPNIHQAPAVSTFPDVQAFPSYHTVPAAARVEKVDTYQPSQVIGAVNPFTSSVTSVHEAAPAVPTLHSETPAVATVHSTTPAETAVHETGPAKGQLACRFTRRDYGHISRRCPSCRDGTQHRTCRDWCSRACSIFG
ncbi:hypothetical protein MRX96_007806 [Rhipicephalus microplus]